MFKRFLLGVGLLLLLQGHAVAQGMMEPVKVPVKVRLSGGTADYTHFTDPHADLTIGGTYYSMQAGGDTTDGTVQSEIETAYLEVGKTYEVQTSNANGGSANTLKMTPPVGYTMLMNGKAKTSMSVGANAMVTVRVLPPSESMAAPAGTTTEFELGRVKFALSLGTLKSGVSGGWLSIVGAGVDDNWNPYIDASSLYYEEDSSDLYVYRVNNANSVKTISQISMVEAFVTVTTVADPVTGPTLVISFYKPATATGSSYPKTVTGGRPFVSYRISLVSSDGSTKSRKLTAIREFRDITGPTDTDVTAPVSRREFATLERIGTAESNYCWISTGWTLESSTPVACRVSQWSANATSGHDEVIKVGDSATITGNTVTVNNPVIQTRNVHDLILNQVNIPYAQVLTNVTAGDPSDHPDTVAYTYHTDSGNRASYGFTKTQVSAGGNWTYYEYVPVTNKKTDDDKLGTIGKTYAPFVSTPATPGNTAAAGVYTTFDYDADVFKMLTRLKTSQTYVNNVLVAKTSITYTTGSANGYTVVKASRLDQVDSSGTTLASVSKYYQEDTLDDQYRSQPYSVIKPDGTQQSYFYQRGTWDDSTKTYSNTGTSATCVGIFNGASTNLPGSFSMGNYSSKTTDQIWLVTNRSTADFTIRDSVNRIVRTESKVWDGSAWQLVSWMNFNYDNSNRLTSKVSSNGDLYEAHYTNALKDWERDGSGIKISYTYDAAGRVKTSTKEGIGTQPNLVTTYTYDAANQVLQQDVIAAGGSETLTTSKLYDLAGRVKSQTAPAGDGTSSYTTATTTTATTNYSYDPANRTNTVTLPNTKTVVQTAYLDGQLYSKTGSSVVPEYYTYSVDSASGQRVTQVNLATTTSPRYAKTTSDWLGRTVQTERPGSTGQLPFGERNTYNSTTGLLTKTEQGTISGGALTPLRAATLFEYDGLGQPTVSGMDIDGSNVLDRAGKDRIAGQEKYLAYENSAWWLASRGYTYAASGSAVQTTTGSSRQRLSGFTGNLRAETRSTDAEGNTTVRTVMVDRTARTATTTTVIPGLVNPQVETAVNGLATTATTSDGLTVTNGYDSLQRLSTSTNPRTGTSTTGYYPGTTQVYNVKDARDVPVATYGYDAMGRTVWARNADIKYTRSDYNERGQLLHQWGDATYPVSYHYTAYGERDTLQTYQGENNWNGATWPTGSLTGTVSTTTWAYDEPSGLLSKKTDSFGQTGDPSDSVSTGRSVEYDYNARGQVFHRYWARVLSINGPRVMATYAYDTQTAELTNTSYNDTITPAVTTTYNRLGQPSTITDGCLDAGDTTHTSTRTFLWDADSPWRLDAELLPNFYQNRLLSRVYENHTDATQGAVKGRSSGFQLGTLWNPSADLAQTLQCSNLGRVASLTSSNNSGTGAQTFTYAYVPNSRLLQSIAATGTAFTLTRHYEDHRDVLDDIVGKWSTVTRSHHAYVSNDLGQRTKSTQDGDAFADYSDTGEATHQDYLYYPTGELKTGLGYLGTAIDRPLPGRQYYFKYDTVGNRKFAGHAGETGDTEETQFNSLNQITSRQNKSLSVSGTSAADATVVVDNAAASRQGRFWQRELSLANSTGPVAKQIDTIAAKPGAGTAGADLAQIDRRYVLLSGASEVSTYDLDGNLTSDDHWTYTWDAENRLYSMEANAWTGTTYGPARQRLEFRYDYMGRRVLKRVLNRQGTDYVLQTEHKFIYDGWNVIAETETTGAIIRSYTWGLDLGGSLSASGGVGALAQITEHATGQSYFPTYDGNGNVTALVRASDGALSASYEYSPFGELLRTTGSYAKTNPFRFSTKFTDDETSLVYYGKRYYDPHNGRFINRDPIEEAGGINLYGFCGNDGINRTDYLGNSWFSSIFKKIGKWFKQNWTAVVGAALNFIPLVGPALSILWSAGVGYANGGIKGMLIGAAASYIGAKVGGFIGGKLAIPNQFLSKTVTSALSGGFAGGAASVASGGNFGDGFIAGAITGGVLSAGTQLIQNAFGLQYGNSSTLSKDSTFGRIGLGINWMADTLIDLEGKLWTLPNTAIGIAFGGIGYAAGLVMGTDPSIVVRQNAIQFINNPLSFMGDITLGNTTSYHPDLGPDSPRNEGGLGVTQDHEEQHTYQAQLLGPLYLPANLIGGIRSMLIAPSGTYDSWHYNNFMENGPQKYVTKPW